MIHEACAALGCVVERDKLTRVDAAADLAGMDVAVFGEALVSGRVVSRANKRAMYLAGVECSGITCGAGALMVRVYDKAREVREKGDEAKADYLERNRWGGPQEVATRVEFQLRRESLKSMGIDTVDDWLEKRAEVVAYLTGEWCRVVNRVDRKNGNQKKAKTTREWDLVAEAFRDWAGKAEPVVRSQEPRPEADALTQQALGCMLTAHALTEQDVAEDIDEVFAYLADKLYSALQDNEARTIAKLERRHRMAQADGRSERHGPPGIPESVPREGSHG